MMWINNIDIVLKNYLPIVAIDDFVKRIFVSTSIVTILVIWMMEVYNSYKNIIKKL